MLHPISMKIDEGQRDKLVNRKKIDDGISYMVRQLYYLKRKINFQKSSKWLNRSTWNYIGMTTYPWGTKSSPPMTS